MLKTFAIGWNWRDMWIGFYLSKDHRTLFCCPIPFLVLAFGYDAVNFPIS